MKELLFTNPVFHSGTNLTVRHGRKWHLEPRALILGKVYELETKLKIFFEITDADLEQEHDPACRTVDGLFKVLSEVYPGFSRNAEVTFVTFNY